MSPPERQRVGYGRGEAAGSWGRAALRALALVAGALAGLGVIPDRLVALLSTRVSPIVRDLLVTAWVVGAFLVLCWAFVVLQRPRRRST